MIDVFKYLYSDSLELSNKFDFIANEIMNKQLLSIGENHFKVVELEFYFNDSENSTPTHKDEYTHGNKKQLTFGEWYDHPAGIDFTIGNNENIYAGILIRSIIDLKNNNFINGPLNVKNHLKQLGYCKEPLLWVQNQDSYCKVYKVKRFGLPLKSGQEDFYFKKYRFITNLTIANKIKDKERVLEELLIDNEIDWKFIENKFALSYVPSKLKKHDTR